jgi:hypothetical protein
MALMLFILLLEQVSRLSDIERVLPIHSTNYLRFPQIIFPMLGTLPLLCYMGHGHWKAYLMGSGSYGFVGPLSQNNFMAYAHSISGIS